MITTPAGAAADDDFLPLSALQHLLFCERQCALIHIEGLWAENVLTVEGRQLHERADERGSESRGDVRIARGVPLASQRLRLTGRADVVEFHANGTILPVEYKRGRPKRDDCDRVQLCAQALCLEEIHGCRIPRGALYYGQTRRREEVVFDEGLRTRTEAAVTRLHELITARRTPPAVREPKCERCSLLHLCLPSALGPRKSAAAYLRRALASSLAAEGGAP
ncbi:MAG: CRISPR-associated protein Cas4 [Gemmatimonadota bacterium]